MSTRRYTSLGAWRSFSYGFLLVNCIFIGYSESAEETNTTSAKQHADCTTQIKSSCSNCTALVNCVWCFENDNCVDKKDKSRDACKEDDWDWGDCNKKEKEAVLLYVLLACAVFLLLVVVFLVLYIFFCKIPRNGGYSPVNTKDMAKRRNRTPLMSKKFKPAGSRTDELKEKYGLQ